MKAKNIIFVAILIISNLAVGILAAITANYAKKAGDPDKHPHKRSEAATMALVGGAIAFGTIVFIMIVELMKEIFVGRVQHYLK